MHTTVRTHLANLPFARKVHQRNYIMARLYNYIYCHLSIAKFSSFICYLFSFYFPMYDYHIWSIMITQGKQPIKSENEIYILAIMS